MPHGIPDPSAIQRIHLMAICGTGMGAFAGLLKEAGYEVRGSDAGVYPPMSTQLEEQGIELMDGYKPENLDWGPDLVVVGNAIRRTVTEAEAMRERDLTYASFPETLSALFLLHRLDENVSLLHDPDPLREDLPLQTSAKNCRDRAKKIQIFLCKLQATLIRY